MITMPPINLLSFPNTMANMQEINDRENLKALLSQFHDADVLSRTPPPTGRKDDADKLPMHLIDVDALEGMVAVLQFGASKYSSNNWRGGISYTRLIGATLRHTFALVKGEDIDPESGLPHVDHLQCCAHFLSHMMKNRKDLDDRYHPPKDGLKEKK